MIASHQNHLFVVRCLLDPHAAVNLFNIRGFTALVFASQFGYLSMAKVQIERGETDSGGITIIVACAHGYARVTQTLLDFGASIYLAGKDGCTALAAAALAGHGAIVQRLVARGSILDAASATGETPLTVACFRVTKQWLIFSLTLGLL